MPASAIKCCGCGTEGEMEIIGLDPQMTPDLLFRYLGHHEFTGNMYFLCPHCRCEVVVNPMDILDAPPVIYAKSYLPAYASTEVSRSGRNTKRGHL